MFASPQIPGVGYGLGDYSNTGLATPGPVGPRTRQDAILGSFGFVVPGLVPIRQQKAYWVGR